MPILPGIMPITDVSQIKTITGMCGASISAALIEQLDMRADDPEAVASSVSPTPHSSART